MSARSKPYNPFTLRNLFVFVLLAIVGYFIHVHTFKPSSQGTEYKYIPSLLRASVPTPPPTPSVPFYPITGVNVYGLLSHSCGMGRASRNVLKCLLAANGSVTATDITANHFGSKGPIDEFEHYGVSNLPSHNYLFDLFAVNADYTPGILSYIARLDKEKTGLAAGSRFHPYSNHYRIGLWHWETSSLPLPQGFIGGSYNEIWTPTRFVADAIRNTPTFPRTAKVVVLPYGIAMELPLAAGAVREAARSRLQNYTLNVGQLWPAFRKTTAIEKWSQPGSKTTIFLVVFDFKSDFNRKNVIGSMAAFEEAFPPSKGDDVGLIIKMDGHLIPELKPDCDKVMADIMKYNDDRIYYFGGYSADEDLYDIKRGTDCYVSLHRSEGLGLNLLEAIFSGVPTISTAFSGSEDFMDIFYGNIGPSAFI